MARNRDLDHLVGLLASTQHGAFLLGQVAETCDRRVAAARVRAGEWDRIVRGAFVVPRLADAWATASALCLHVPGGAVQGTWAAKWWKLDGVDTGPLRLLVPWSSRVGHPAIVRTRELLDWERRAEPGGCLRFTDPDRTLVDLGAVLDLDHLERAVESAIRRGLTSETRLRMRAEKLRASGRSGPAAVVAVLDRRPKGGNAGSDGEVLLLQLLRSADLVPPYRQYRVGSWFFDLAWPELRIVVELDGAHHRTPEQQRADNLKQNYAILSHWTVLRFSWVEVEVTPWAVIAAVTGALRAAASGASMSR